MTLRERAEREAIAWVKTTPTEHWIAMARPWHRWLPELSPTAQRRVLTTMLEETIRRRDELWPAELIGYFARQAIPHLTVGERPRSRIHDKDAFRKAAEYRARHSKASWNALADAAGVSQSTVRQWAQFPEFARCVADARFNIRQEKLRVWGRWLGEQIKKSHRR